jgi:hypothetical protein
MGDDKRDGSKQWESIAPPDPGDIGDAAQIQMPGKPPNLAFDPSKRHEELASIAGEHALAEAAKKPSGKVKK